MMRSLVKRSICILILGLVISPINPLQSKVMAAEDIGFIVDVAVVDDSCGEHISNILMPQVAIKFRLSPEVTSLPQDNRYNDTRGNFPEGNASQDTKVIEYEVISGIVTSDKNGVNSFFIKLSDIPELKEGTSNWGQFGKVYRYNLEMIGVYKTDNNETSPTVDRSKNYLHDGNYFDGPTHTAMICDIYIDYSGRMDSAIFWDESASEKAVGFVKNDTDTSSCVKYRVLDFELSTDYIGKYPNSIAGKVTYFVGFESMPEFLTNNYTDTSAIYSSISAKNKDSWVVYFPFTPNDKYLGGSYGGDSQTVPTNKEAGVVSAEGALSDNDNIIFSGLPKEGKDGRAIHINSYLKTDNITDLSGNDARDIYKDYIFYAQNVGRIDDSVTTLDKFFQHEFANKYDNIKKRVHVFTPSSGIGPDVINVYYEQLANIYLPLTESNGTENNNFRYVIFDPDELVIVGVTLNLLPGIVAILIFFTTIIAFIVVSRKRRRID